MGPVRTALVATCVFLGSAAAASAETITVPHSSGGTIERDATGYRKDTFKPAHEPEKRRVRHSSDGSIEIDEKGYKPGTFTPKDKVADAPEPKVGKGQGIRKAMTAGTFLPAAQVVGKQVAKKGALAAAATAAGPALGLAIVIGGTAYTGYEAYRWLKGP